MRWNIVTVSNHALQRYRIHYPDARPREVLAVVAASLPIPSEVAHGLAGRTFAATATEEEHRLHPMGTGVFVLQPLENEPGSGFVRTYLRLYGEEQRRFARELYLDPLPVLRTAFELGFRAARAPGASSVAAIASEHHLDALSRLVPGVALAVAAGREVVAAEASAPAPEAAPEAAPEQPPSLEVDVGAVPWGRHLCPAALSALAGFYKTHRGASPDLGAWRLLEPDVLAGFVRAGLVASPGGCLAVMQPDGFVVLLFAPQHGGGWRYVGMRTVPRDGREAIAASSVALTGDLPAAASSVALTGDLPAAAVGRAASSPAEAVPAEIRVVRPCELHIESWSPTAIRDAQRLGFERFPPQWLDQLDPLEPEDAARVIRESGWVIERRKRYAVCLSQGCALLLTQTDGGRSGVISRIRRLDAA